jgi:hypothetical protein
MGGTPGDSWNASAGRILTAREVHGADGGCGTVTVAGTEIQAGLNQ